MGGQALDSNHTKGLHLDRKLSGSLVSGGSRVGGKVGGKGNLVGFAPGNQ